MSSRFVQEENVLTLESVYLGYEFYDGWIQKLGLSNLNCRFLCVMYLEHLLLSLREVFLILLLGVWKQDYRLIFKKQVV